MRYVVRKSTVGGHTVTDSYESARELALHEIFKEVGISGEYETPLDFCKAAVAKYAEESELVLDSDSHYENIQSNEWSSNSVYVTHMLYCSEDDGFIAATLAIEDGYMYVEVEEDDGEDAEKLVLLRVTFDSVEEFEFEIDKSQDKMAESCICCAGSVRETGSSKCHKQDSPCFGLMCGIVKGTGKLFGI